MADDREREWRRRFAERPAVYLDRTSAAPGDAVQVHASAGTAARLVVARVGAAREPVLDLSLGQVARQDLNPKADQEGCDWRAVTAFTVGRDWRPGYYDVVLAADGQAPTHTFLCVRRAPEARPAPLLLVLATNTLQSYNWWGGANAYADVTGLMAGADLPTAMAGTIGRLSHRRPYVQTLIAPATPTPRMVNLRRRGRGERSWSDGITSDLTGEMSPYDNSAGYLRRWEHLFVAWCEKNGYALDFATDLDLDREPGLLEPYRAVTVVGHSEYWSGRQRAAVEDFVDAGGRFAIFSGNTCYWKVRQEDDYRTLVNHKWRGETADPLFQVPGREREATHLWSHPAFANPEARLTGLSFLFGGYHRVGLCVSRGAGGYTLYRDDHWSLAGTDLRYGDLFGDLGVSVGYECDGCRFVLGEDGLPRPVPVVGVPEDLEILALAPCTLAEQPHPDFPAIIAPESLEQLARITSGAAGPNEIGRLLRGHAVMASFRRGRGEVFNGGSTEWAHGLAQGDPFIDRITRNVLDRFTA